MSKRTKKLTLTGGILLFAGALFAVVFLTVGLNVRADEIPDVGADVTTEAIDAVESTVIPAGRVYPNGTLLKSNSAPAIYQVFNSTYSPTVKNTKLVGLGELQTFPDWSTFITQHNYNEVVIVSDAELALYTKVGKVVYQDGTLIRVAGSPTVYYVMEGAAFPFRSATTFLARGFKFTNVKVVSSLKGVDTIAPSSLLDVWLTNVHCFQGTLTRDFLGTYRYAEWSSYRPLFDMGALLRSYKRTTAESVLISHDAYSLETCPLVKMDVKSNIPMPEEGLELDPHVVVNGAPAYIALSYQKGTIVRDTQDGKYYFMTHGLDPDVKYQFASASVAFDFYGYNPDAVISGRTAWIPTAGVIDIPTPI
ncbi:hypothetical protein ACFL1U_03165 [Patescibacteria group bacterium]